MRPTGPAPRINAEFPVLKFAFLIACHATARGSIMAPTSTVHVIRNDRTTYGVYAHKRFPGEVRGQAFGQPRHILTGRHLGQIFPNQHSAGYVSVQTENLRCLP